MGFFDKLKSAANFLTGGGATVNVAVMNEENDGWEPIRVMVQVQVKDADINIRNCYVKVRATERVWMRPSRLFTEQNGEFYPLNDDISDSTVTWEAQVLASGATELQANQSYEFEVEFQIPEAIPGSYYGRQAEHTYQILAALDMSGNDPDSGWLKFEVAK